MKYRKLKILLMLATVSCTAFSQIGFSIGPVVGYTSPSGDMSGTTSDFYAGTKYGMNGAVNFGAQLKLKLLIINAKASVNYVSMKNTGSSPTSEGSIENKLQLLTFGVGTELHLPLPLIPVNPYLSIELLFTNFSGESIFQGVPRVPSGTYNLSSGSRSGLGVGAGAEISFGKKTSLDLGIRYNIYNLFGREFSGGNNRIDSYTSINDEADPLNSSDPDTHPISSSRIISAIQFNASFLFDLSK